MSLAAVAGLVAAGCAAGRSPAPDPGGLCNRAAQAGIPGRHPVIVVPGILGSRRSSGAA